MQEKKLWERQAFDTNTSFEAFRVYRDMGASRSLEKLSQTLGKTKANYEQMSTKNRWQERVSAYDTHLDTLNLEDNEKRQKLIKDNAYSDYLTLRRAIDKIKTTLEDVDFRGIPAYELSNLASLMKQADDYARRAVGLPDKITEAKTAIANDNDKPFQIAFVYPDSTTDDND